MAWQTNLRRLFVVGFLLASGCGPSPEVRPPLHPTQGLLTINGEPAAGAMVVLHPADGKSFDDRGTRPKATVNADGTFELTTYQNGDGAPAGDYRVSILWLMEPDSSSRWDRLGGRYANPDSTDLRVSIGETANLLNPIRLEGIPLATRRPQADSSDFDQVD
ncbi:MAG: hypothetical protein WBC44_10690 [Planctomycetaceae bacterium]